MHKHDVTTTMIVIVLMDGPRSFVRVRVGRTNQRQNAKSYNTLLIACVIGRFHFSSYLPISTLPPQHYHNIDLTTHIHI